MRSCHPWSPRPATFPPPYYTLRSRSSRTGSARSHGASRPRSGRPRPCTRATHGRLFGTTSPCSAPNGSPWTHMTCTLALPASGIGTADRGLRSRSALSHLRPPSAARCSGPAPNPPLHSWPHMFCPHPRGAPPYCTRALAPRGVLWFHGLRPTGSIPVQALPWSTHCAPPPPPPARYPAPQAAVRLLAARPQPSRLRLRLRYRALRLVP